MSTSVFFSPSHTCHFVEVRAVSHMYTGKTTASRIASGHQ